MSEVKGFVPEVGRSPTGPPPRSGGEPLGVQAATGLLAVVGLLLVMDWFFRRVYWTGWMRHHRRRRRLLAATGVLLGVVLVVMVGESVQELQLAGWLPVTTVPLAIPDWVGLWLAVFRTVESLATQALAAALVIGSYLVAKEIRVKRPRRAGVAVEAAG